MTARSIRRAAEIELIDAALEFIGKEIVFTVAWERDIDTHRHYTTVGAARRMRSAVAAYKALPLDDATKGRTSKGAPVTSHSAHAYMHGNRIGTLVGQIVRLFYTSSGGLSSNEVEAMTGRPHQSVSARINELRDNGWIVDSGRTTLTATGHDETIWKLSAKARMHMQDAWATAGRLASDTAQDRGEQ